eukprot:gene13668-12550_t
MAAVHPDKTTPVGCALWIYYGDLVFPPEDRNMKRKRGHTDAIAKRQWDDRRFTDCTVVSSCGAEFAVHRSFLAA